MNIIVSEFVGTALLLLLGNSVVANTVLKKSYGYGGGIVAITLGWGVAVFIGASVAHKSGGQINPAVTLAFAALHKVAWSDVPKYLIGQLLGAMTGAGLTYLAYKKQFDENGGKGTLGIFSTIPNIRHDISNFITELIGTFTLVLWILESPSISVTPSGTGIDFGNAALGYAAVMFVVIGIGLSLGGPTGYAINPARDLGPRIVYAFILPMKNKDNPSWNYAYIPVLAPIMGAILAAAVSKLI